MCALLGVVQIVGLFNVSSFGSGGIGMLSHTLLLANAKAADVEQTGKA